MTWTYTDKHLNLGHLFKDHVSQVYCTHSFLQFEERTWEIGNFRWYFWHFYVMRNILTLPSPHPWTPDFQLPKTGCTYKTPKLLFVQSEVSLVLMSDTRKMREIKSSSSSQHCPPHWTLTLFNQLTEADKIAHDLHTCMRSYKLRCNFWCLRM